MSRTYANFLLFEDVLDNIPNSSPIMTQAVDMLVNPQTRIVNEDCGTLLGSVLDTSLELEGLTEVATGDPLTYSRIVTLLGQGKYKTRVRSLNTCLSHTNGGICRKCYEATFLGSTAPEVDKLVTMASSLIYQSDVLLGDGFDTEFTLSQTEDDWYDVIVVNQGAVVDPSTYTLGFDTITFNDPPSSNIVAGLHVVHFFKQNTEPFLGYISKTYSGALLGMQALPTLKPLLRESIYESLFSDSFVSMLMDETAKFKAIPSTYMAYLDKVHGKMEKVLLAIYLFAIYGNIQI
jgi:hypothetical protein